MIPIIAFCGPIGCGKTTIAKEFLRLHPKWISLSFADPLRVIIEYLYCIDSSVQKNQDAKLQRWPELNGNTLRYAMQQIGTEGIRSANPYTFTNFLKRTVSELPSSVHGVVIEDCRFVNEVNFLHESMKAKVVFIDNPETTERLMDDADRYLSFWNVVRKKLHLPYFQMHQSEFDISLAYNMADYKLPNIISTKSNSKQYGRVDVPLIEESLYKMLRVLCIHTEWRTSHCGYLRHQEAIEASRRKYSQVHK